MYIFHSSAVHINFPIQQLLYCMAPCTGWGLLSKELREGADCPARLMVSCRIQIPGPEQRSGEAQRGGVALEKRLPGK